MTDLVQLAKDIEVATDRVENHVREFRTGNSGPPGLKMHLDSLQHLAFRNVIRFAQAQLNALNDTREPKVSIEELIEVHGLDVVTKVARQVAIANHDTPPYTRALLFDLRADTIDKVAEQLAGHLPLGDST